MIYVKYCGDNWVEDQIEHGQGFCSIGGSAPSGNTTTTTTNQPWKQQIPFLIGGTDSQGATVPGVLPRAANLFTSGGLPPFYPGTAVAPFSTPTKQAISAETAYGQAPQTLYNNARAGLSTQLNPNFLYNTPGMGVFNGIANNPNGNPATSYAARLAANQPGSGVLGGLAGQGNQTAARQYLSPYARGQMLNNNPTLNAIWNSTAGNIANAFNTTTLPQTQSQMEMAGRYGSGASAATTGAADRALASQLSTAGANLFGQDYVQQQANQLNAANMIGRQQAAQQGIEANAANSLFGNAGTAAGLLGQIGNQNLQSQLTAATGMGTDVRNAAYNAGRAAATSPLVNQMPIDQISALSTAGSTTDAFTQAVINNQMQQYAYNSMLPFNSLQAYSNAVMGNLGGTSTTRQPYYNNTGSNLLGAGIGLGTLPLGIGGGAGAAGSILGALLGSF